MAEPIPASDSKANPPVPTPAPVEVNPDASADGDSLPYNQFETFAGGKFGISDTFQMGVGAAGLPLSWLFMGASGWTNFSDKHSLLAEIGFRGKPALAFSVQPTALIGAGFLSEHEIISGRLAEKTLLSGTSFMVGGELRLQIDPIPEFGFYVAPGYMHEERGGLEALPAALISGDDPKSSANFFTLSFGLRLGLAPNRPFHQEEKKAAPAPKPSPKEEKPKPMVAIPVNLEDIKKKIIDDLKSGGKAEAAESLSQKIDDFQKKLKTFEGHLQFWQDGIDLTHLLAKSFQTTIDGLNADPKAPVDPSLEKDLKLLEDAAKLDSEGNRISNTPESKAIQVGNRLLYPDLTKPYGEKLLRQLKEIEAKLRTQADRKELRQKVKDSIDALDNYLKKKTRWIELKDLQDEWEKLQVAETELKAEGTKNNLQDNGGWALLTLDFGSKKSKLADTYKTVENVVRLAALFQTETNEFQDVVKKPEDAVNVFQKANTLIEKEKIKTHYLSYLAYHLDRFISRHSSPTMKEAEAKKWEQAVAEAKKLRERVRLTNPED